MSASNGANARAVLKRLCPPVLVDLARRKTLFPKWTTWEGIYPQLGDVPGKTGAYDSSDRVEEFVTHTRTSIDALKAGKPQHPGWHQPLALLAGSLMRGQNRLKVLDLGGGVGLAYVQLLSALHCNVELRYIVVELENMCRAGRQLFGDDSRIEFYRELPSDAGHLDVVYASSVLPYVDDYVAAVQRLVGLKASYLLFTQLAAGDFPTYAATQLNLPGQVLPYRFLNIDELIRLVTAGGYSCVYTAEAGPVYDQRNYPPAYRLGRMKTLLFVRERRSSEQASSPLRGGNA
jgi:putative methyltransferase (TIGR04325 family)